MHDAALILALGRREIGYRDEAAAKPEGAASRTAEPLRGLFEGKRAASGSSREPLNVKDVGTLGLGLCGGVCRGWFVGGLDRVDANRSIEKGGSEEVWVAGTPIDLERPVIRRWELDDVSEQGHIDPDGKSPLQ